MPELPDVEIFRRYAEKYALNQQITSIDIDEPQVADTKPENIKNALRNNTFKKAERIGKFLFLPTEKQVILVIHFGMTGWLEYQNNQKPSHARATFSFSNNKALYFVNQRKLGRLYLTQNVESFCREKGIGPDALVIGEEFFMNEMKQKKGMIKSALMDQSFIAGIGNIYSDEILFQTGIHPKTRIQMLRDKDLVNLFHLMKDVLLKAIESNADPDNLPGDFIIPRRNEGDECPFCEGTVKKDKLSGRGFYYCPNCQRN
jgi:formamidopyrimidine-DNA glycosylase